MDCCGHGTTLTPRHWMSRTGLSSVGAMLAGDLGPRGSTAAARTAETASAALDVLRKIHLRRRPYAWRQDRDHIECAAERRPRKRHAVGIACGLIRTID